MNKTLVLPLGDGGKEEVVQGGERRRFLMKVCPECRTKNDDVDHFCKKCGFLIIGSSLIGKGEKVLGRQKKFPWVFLSLFLITLVLGLAFWIVWGRITFHPKIAVQTKGGHENILEGIQH